jgi:hypothetical protein
MFGAGPVPLWRSPMLSFLLSGALAPFTAALAMLAGLMVLELVLALLGGSIFAGGEVDAPALDAPELDLPDLDGIDLEGFEVGADVDGPDLGEAPAVTGVSSFLGLGKPRS